MSNRLRNSPRCEFGPEKKFPVGVTGLKAESTSGLIRTHTKFLKISNLHRNIVNSGGQLFPSPFGV